MLVNSFWTGAAFANNNTFIFGGTDERFTTADDVLDITGAFSVTAWFKTTATGSTHDIICKDTTSGSSRSWLVRWRGSTNRYVDFVVWNTDGTQNTLTGTINTYDDGNWHNVTCTYSGSNDTNGMKIYMNGTIDKQKTAGSTGVRNYTGANSQVAIGSTSGATGGSWFIGSIGQVAVWDGTELTSGNASSIGSTSPIDLTSYSPSLWFGTTATWDSTDHTWQDDGSIGADALSENMELADYQTDVP